VAVFRNGVEQSLKTLQGCTVYEGHARFVAERKVAVNGSELAADQIFINVGAQAKRNRLRRMLGSGRMVVASSQMRRMRAYRLL
jgi:pyruvate/2-oxoglutarate dehydrogenase complex dihydrolipoamide dehydrogenase (E3) component